MSDPNATFASGGSPVNPVGVRVNATLRDGRTLEHFDPEEFGHLGESVANALGRWGVHGNDVRTVTLELVYG